MVRSPCCEKMGLKKGPWTPEEDKVLVAYIQRHGHGNWRALPKQAGLLRCGKSCRLRWINYLRPDVKRGNFSQEEEETIYKLHELLGNRWSAIAAQLPGRTDNEIKNVWHTRLKKRLDRSGETPEDRSSSAETLKCDESAERDSEPMNFLVHQELQSPAIVPVSPQHSDISSSGTDSSLVTSENLSTSVKDEHVADANDNLWSEALSAENTIMSNYFPETRMDQQLQFPFHPASLQDGLHGDSCMDFWFNLFVDANNFTELPEF